jgi:hypothetical protein
MLVWLWLVSTAVAAYHFSPPLFPAFVPTSHTVGNHKSSASVHKANGSLRSRSVRNLTAFDETAPLNIHNLQTPGIHLTCVNKQIYTQIHRGDLRSHFKQLLETTSTLPLFHPNSLSIIAIMAERYIPEHRRTQFKAKGTFKPEELRRRREEQQVEIRKAKREENLAKRRGITGSAAADRPGASLGAAPDSDDDSPPTESQVCYFTANILHPSI